MEIKLLITAIIFCSSFVLSFFGLKMFLKTQRNADTALSPFHSIFIVLCPLIFLAAAAIYFQTLPQEDFLYPLSFPEICLAGCLSLLVYFLAFFSPRPLYSFLGILLSMAVISLFVPREFLLFDGSLPFAADRILLVFIFSFFCFGFKYLNGIEGLLNLHFIFSMLVIFLLSLVEGVPVALGLTALAIIGILSAFQIFNAYPARLQLNTAESAGLGFIITWITLKATIEGAAACCLTFNLFYIYTVAAAVIAKFSLRPDRQNITTNTGYYRALIKGLSPADICSTVGRLLLFLTIISAFQLYAPNWYSIPLFSLLAVIWFSEQLKNWDKKNPTLKEINNDILNEFKNNIDEIKNNLRKDD